MKYIKYGIVFLLLLCVVPSVIIGNGSGMQDVPQSPPAQPSAPTNIPNTPTSSYNTPAGTQTQGMPSSVKTVLSSPSNCSCAGPNCILNYGAQLTRTIVKWDSYDMHDNHIITARDNVAGTQIGFNLYEERQATWYAGSTTYITCSCVKKVMKCSDYVDKRGNSYKHCWQETEYYSYAQTASETWCYNINRENAYRQAVSIVSTDPSYKMTLSDPNDARCNNYEKYKSQLDKEGVKCENYDNVKPVFGKVSPKYTNPVIGHYNYEMYGSCINAKTGKVRYLESKCTENCCGEEEYYVKNQTNPDNRHWHIFTPLNTKENEKYKIDLIGNSIKSKDLCLAYIKTYPDKYLDYIKPVKGEFTNVESVNKKIIENQNGCYLKLTVSLDIKQLFYNEKQDVENEEESYIHGFKIYYRAVKPNDPFPNGINNNSFWKRWEDERDNGINSLDFSKSFNQVSYTVKNINENSVRNFNSFTNYTTWGDMELDGTSNFITYNGIINRNDGLVNKNTYHNLGCGKLNQCPYLDADHKISNPLYIDKCSDIPNGDICP